VKWWRAFLPHFFGAMPLLTLALSAGKAAYKYGQWTPALPLLSRGALFLVAWLVWLRIGVVYVRSPKRKPAKFTALLDLREVRYGKVMVAILAIPPMFLAGFLIWPVSLGWALGSGTILCLAASGWVSLGSLLVYFGSTYRVPVFAALFSLAVVSSCWMDNHGIRQVEKRMKTPIVAAVPEAGIINEGPLADEARRWLKSRLTGKETKENRRPIFVVAAEGGGIRAAAGDLDWPVLVKLLTGGAAGAIAGSLLANKLPSTKLKFVLCVALVGLGGNLAWKGLSTAMGW
jgi:hypothetical protein